MAIIEALDKRGLTTFWQGLKSILATKGDGLWVNSETNKLYLTANGLPIGNGVTVSTTGGSGGGGAAVGETYIMTLTNSLPSRAFSVADNTPVVLSFAYLSVDNENFGDGAGIGTLSVNNVVKKTVAVPQGNNTLDVTQYLSSGDNTVKLTVVNSEETVKTLTYQINVIALSISTTFSPLASYSGAVAFNYTPSGSGTKTIHFVMDGTEISTAIVESSNRSQSFTIPAQSHGAHIFECYATMTVDMISVQSNVITLGMMWIDQNNSTPIVLCPFNVTNAQEGETLTIPYMVYDPLTETASLTRTILDSEDNEYATSTITVDRTPQSWSVFDYPAGTTKFVLTCGSVSVAKEVAVAESTLVIEPVTDALLMEFSATGRNNNEANPASWSNHGYSATFSGFGWTGADGWVDDANGNTALRFLPNDFMTIPFKAFETDARTAGLTIEAEFATRDVQDYDSVVISSMANGRGFKIASQNAELKSEQSSVSMQFKEDSHVRVCFAVENRNQNRLVYIYINGVMCGVSQYPINDDFSQPEPVGISIGAESCGIDLYRVRIYGKGLTKDEQLDNYIYDRPTLAQREAAYRRNDVLNQSEEVDLTKLPPTLPYMIFECAELPQYKGDKKTGINVTYVDPANASNSFTATGVEMDVQGTSSAGYPVKNFKPKFKQGFHMTATGITEAKFKLRPTSLPVSTFCLKADFASSENANNVKLVDFYEQTCPYKTPPQQADARVRQGIDGIPIVVFWQDLQGNVSFIGKYNFNNDKSTANVFGFTDDYPNAESWEFRNNTSNRCLLKVSDYSDESWLNDFEARYPEDSTNFTQLKRVTDWIASTDRDAVQSAEDKAARLAKFTSEFETYFVKSATLFYYLFTEVFLMIDSRAKNMFLTTYDGTHWLPLPYDFDTAIGINNEGVLSFDYDLEDTDTVGGANVFNGQTSVLWNNVRDAFGSDIKAMYKTLRSGNAFNYAHIKEMFDEHQSVWPEAIWNEDAFVKYLKPYLIDNENYLSMLQGSKESQRDWWLFNAFKYRDSKYQAGDALSNYITLRCYALGDITVTPYSHIHPTIKYGSYTVTTRGKRNTAYTLVNPMDQMNDTEVYIYSADRIKDVGDLSGLQVGYANFAAATKLQSLKLGDSDALYNNTNLKELYVGNNELLKTVDIRNCTALGTDAQKTVDLSGCASLEKVYAQGTALGGVTLPNGGHVNELHFPDSLTNFTILNQKNLETLTFEGLTALTTLRVENTPNVDIEDIVDSATSLNRVRLIGVNWTATSSTTLEDTIDKLASCIGMDAAGNNTAKAVVTGTVDVPSITLELYDSIRAEFPELNITADGKALHIVTFMNGSTVYERQLVAHGEDATAPLVDPTKESTAQYSYTFSGWSPAYENITADKTINAQYTSTVRTYTVRFYNGETLLQTLENVAYGTTPLYTGETPVDEAHGNDFSGWKPTLGAITGNTDYVAKFYAPYLTFSSENSFTLEVVDHVKYWNGTMESSTDATNWSTWDATTVLSSAVDDGSHKIYLRGTGNNKLSTSAANADRMRWVITGTNVACEGNIGMLLDYATAARGESSNATTYCFCRLFLGCSALVAAPDLLMDDSVPSGIYSYMFYGCTSLTTAPELVARSIGPYAYQNMFERCTALTTAPNLPATSATKQCYYAMFKDCRSLVTAPSLPATTLADHCYAEMFNGCISLTVAPNLPAITLAKYCYSNMFKGCTSISIAPELPATNMVEYCYDNMFNGCTSLVVPPMLPATTLARYCYQGMFANCTALQDAPELPATTLDSACYKTMFNGCTSLINMPTLPATVLTVECYSTMFQNCVALTSAPTLPATVLASKCYYMMFVGCRSLVNAPVLPATTLVSQCYSAMFQNCTSLIAAPALPAKTAVLECYASMFRDCTSLTIPPALPATVLDTMCYASMFYACKALTTLPELPATELPLYCYNNMFGQCTSLHLHTTQTQNWSYEYRIPTSGTGSAETTYAIASMFQGVGNITSGTPELNRTYYVAKQPVPAV